MVKLDESEIVEKGRVGPGQMIARRSRRRRASTATRELKDELAARQPFGEWAKRIRVIDHIVKADATEPVQFEREELRRRQLAVGHHARGAGADPPSDGGGREGGGRLHGRRHAARRAVGAIPRPAPLLPPELQPGDQPADRQPARDAGDDAEDAARQSRQRAGRGREPVRAAAARKPGALDRRVRGDARRRWARPRSSWTAPSPSPTARARCAPRSSASAARPRRRCAPAAPT